MDVQVDGDLIRLQREKRAWSQEHLAGAAGIGVRTVQRIEATGVASYESARAISAALEIPVGELRAGDLSAAEPPSVSAPQSSAPEPRSSFALRFVGAAVALVVLAAASGFFLLHDYQKVRVLRTLEVWVTQLEPPADAANRADGR